MQNTTLKYYDDNAIDIASNYRDVNFNSVQKRIETWLPNEGNFLEIGCGSGRDAADFLARGYNVFATDASLKMLAEAKKHYPQLDGRLLYHQLPEKLPFPPDYMSVVYAISILMHLSESDFQLTLNQFYRVLRPGGIMAFSVTTERSGLDEEGFDKKGRYFSVHPIEYWESCCMYQGFSIMDSWESMDITGRPGIRWGTLVCKK